MAAPSVRCVKCSLPQTRQRAAAVAHDASLEAAQARAALEEVERCGKTGESHG